MPSIKIIQDVTGIHAKIDGKIYRVKKLAQQKKFFAVEYDKDGENHVAISDIEEQLNG